ncbi:LAS seventeen-binding protein 5 [Monosporozyma servazzii]
MVGMSFLKDRPRTAITDTLYSIVSSPDTPIESQIGSLIRLIRDAIEYDNNDYQYTLNQEETARCLRKKLKWGNELQQYRSLQILDLFITQGLRFGIVYNDTKLIERLTVIALNQKSDGNGQAYDVKVIKFLRSSLENWDDYIRSRHYEHKRTYESIINLFSYVRDNKMNKIDSSASKKKNKVKNRRMNRRAQNNFMDDSADESVYQSATTSNQYRNRADAKYRIPKIDMRREGPKIQVIISNALAAAISLENSLVILPQNVNAMDDEDATAKFIQARTIRRKVLKYLQLVTEGEFLGSLLHANDELVKALTQYDTKSKIEDEDAIYNSDATEEDEYQEGDSLANYESSDDSDQDSDDDANGWTVDTHPSVHRAPPRRQNSFSNDPFADDNQL